MDDLYVTYSTLDNFHAAWDQKTSDINNGTPIPLNIEGLTELPPLRLNVLAAGGQVAIQGDTWIAQKFFSLKRLGAAAKDRDTFAWESHARAFVCTRPWSADRVRGLLVAAAAGKAVAVAVAA